MNWLKNWTQRLNKASESGLGGLDCFLFFVSY